MQRIKDSASISVESLCPHAERELAAFARAVQELFGPEQARQAIEYWIEQLESTDCRSPETVRDWRGLTIAAAVRLASRTNGLPQRPAIRSERVSKRKARSRSVQELDLLENIGSGLGDHDAKVH